MFTLLFLETHWICPKVSAFRRDVYLKPHFVHYSHTALSQDMKEEPQLNTQSTFPWESFLPRTLGSSVFVEQISVLAFGLRIAYLALSKCYAQA